MYTIKVDLSQSHFASVSEAITSLGYEPSYCDSDSVLVWVDTLSPVQCKTIPPPWKAINRIPHSNVLCKKNLLSINIKRAKEFFPELYCFYPNTFIIPSERKNFLEVLKNSEREYLIKPSSGSFGRGIRIINHDSLIFTLNEEAVAQEYVKSFLLNDTKFDLRIFVLVSSVNPLKIYIFRDGVARFCSLKSKCNSKYSRITNVALNRNANGSNVKDTSVLISNVFSKMEKEGINTNEIWNKIDDIVVLTIISSYKYLLEGDKEKQYNYCFQIFGFDILLDEKLNPYLLEVNYRPSLDYYTGFEKRMKVEMIRDAIRIAVPFGIYQELVSSRKWCWTRSSWLEFINKDPEIQKICDKDLQNVLDESNYSLIYPVKETSDKYKKVIDKVLTLPKDQIVDLEK